MLFLLCSAIQIITPTPRTIIWHEEISQLTASTRLTDLQIKWITDVDVFKSDTDKFSREFNTKNLTWPQIRTFRHVMHRLLTDIVRGVRLGTETLPPEHPLFPIYIQVLTVRNSSPLQG
jgi:hypothetical protein